tara:strand:+ start:1307 stop:1681 length:375 start_codon:yes stop_codon:yes gene_type:complete
MKNLIILFLFFTTTLFSQSPLQKFEGIWSTPHSYWYKVFTYNEKDDILEIYTFSFGDPSAVVEKIVKITSDYAIDTKLINHDNRWKVNITYRMLENKKIIATYTGDINTMAELTKATLNLNHVE